MRTSITLSSIALSALLTATAAANERDCQESVIARDYTRTISACLELPRDNRMAMLDALSKGDYVHYLGTVERPSQAFALLRAHAATGDVDAQYVFGTLYSMVHVRSPENWRPDESSAESREAHNSSVRAEAAVWIKKAADQGHTLAMLDLADYYVQLSYEDPSVDLKSALSYANRAGENNQAMAALTVEKVQRRMDELK